MYISIRDRTEWGDLGSGHGSIFENPKWFTYRNAQKRPFGVFKVFLAKNFLRRFRHRKNVQNHSFFAQKWVTFHNFRRLRHRKVGDLSIWVTPLCVGTPHLIPDKYVDVESWKWLLLAYLEMYVQWVKRGLIIFKWWKYTVYYFTWFDVLNFRSTNTCQSIFQLVFNQFMSNFWKITR